MYLQQKHLTSVPNVAYLYPSSDIFCKGAYALVFNGLGWNITYRVAFNANTLYQIPLVLTEIKRVVMPLKAGVYRIRPKFLRSLAPTAGVLRKFDEVPNEYLRFHYIFSEE